MLTNAQDHAGLISQMLQSLYFEKAFLLERAMKAKESQFLRRVYHYEQ